MDSEKEEPVAMSDLSPESQKKVRVMRREVETGKYSEENKEGMEDPVIVAQVMLAVAYEDF